MNCISHLMNKFFFKVRAIVTNKKFYSGLRSSFPNYHDVDFISNEARNVDAILLAIKKLDIDTLISVQHNWILPKTVLDAVNGNAFNLHNAKLPEYKGYNSIFYSLINNDSAYTSTIHLMNEVVDSGDIIIEGITKIYPDDTALSLYARTVDVATNTFLSFLNMLKDKNFTRKPMGKGGEYFNRGHMEKMKNINIKDNSEIIERIIRASYFPPYEPAYIMVGKKKNYLTPSPFQFGGKVDAPYNKSEWEQ